MVVYTRGPCMPRCQERETRAAAGRKTVSAVQNKSMLCIYVWSWWDLDQSMRYCWDQDQNMWFCWDQDKNMWYCWGQDENMWSCWDQDQNMSSCWGQDQNMSSCWDQDQRATSWYHGVRSKTQLSSGSPAIKAKHTTYSSPWDDNAPWGQPRIVLLIACAIDYHTKQLANINMYILIII